MNGIRRWLDTGLATILVASICWPVAALVAAVLLPPSARADLQPGGLLMLGGATGLLIALAQRVVLRRRLAARRSWEVATVGGTLAGLLLAALPGTGLPAAWVWISGAAGGGLYGLAQSLAVNENARVRLGLVWAGTLSWAAAFGISAFVPAGTALLGNFFSGSGAVQAAVVGWPVTGLLALLALVATASLNKRDVPSVRTRWW